MEINNLFDFIVYTIFIIGLAVASIVSALNIMKIASFLKNGRYGKKRITRKIRYSLLKEFFINVIGFILALIVLFWYGELFNYIKAIQLW